MSDTKIKDIIFSGMKGCGDNGCHIEKPVGMGTNGGCRCCNDRSKQSRVFSRVSCIDAYLKQIEEEVNNAN